MVLLKVEHQRRAAAGQHDEQADPVLRHAEVGAVDDVRADLVAQCADGHLPGWIQLPVHELRSVLDHAQRWPVKLQTGDGRPGGGTGGVMLRVARFFAARLAVALATG
ncbi:hypothetical protein D9M71_779540 [compost metagenome]